MAEKQRKLDPDRGNMIGFLNTRKLPGDNRPVFQGKLNLPGIETERGFALWAVTSEKSGATVLTGRAGESAMAQIDNFTRPESQHDADTTIALAQRDGADGLEIKAHAMVMFVNKSKDQDTQSRPDYWGYYNPGKGEPLMRLAAWAKTDQNGKAMLTGSLQKDEPRRDRESSVDGPSRRDSDSRDRDEPEPEREHSR